MKARMHLALGYRPRYTAKEEITKQDKTFSALKSGNVTSLEINKNDKQQINACCSGGDVR